MRWYDVMALVVFGCLTLALMILKMFKIGNRRRGVVKMITAAFFLAAGIFGAIRLGGGLHILAAVGLAFAALGDLCLVFKDNAKWFFSGIVSFGCASLCLSIYSIFNFGWHWLSLILIAVAVVANFLCQHFKVYSYGGFKVVLNIYIVLVATCGLFGLTVLCYAATIPAIFFGLGCLMYFCSDLCLGMYMFRFRYQWVDAINSMLYFPGMLFVALSMLL